MIKPVREIITVPANHQYYHSAYAANAKLQLGAVQMDKIVTDDICMHIIQVFFIIIKKKKHRVLT
jgi:hypothetical protein